MISMPVTERGSKASNRVWPIRLGLAEGSRLVGEVKVAIATATMAAARKVIVFLFSFILIYVESS